VSRVRQLSRIRSQSESPVISRQPPPPQSPLSPGVVRSASNLRDFATREHLARLDASVEKLDTYVETSVEQLLAAVNDQRENLEKWVENKMESWEERMREAVTTVQQTKGVLESAVSSLSSSGKPAGITELETRLREKLSSLEERLAAGNLVQGEMQGRLQSFEERLTSEIYIQLRQQVDPVRITQLEERVTSVMAKAPFLEASIEDLASSLKGRSASKDAQEQMIAAQSNRLQAAVSDIATRLDGLSGARQLASDAEKAAVEERFASLQAQLSTASAYHISLKAALAAVSQRQSADEEKAAAAEEARGQRCLWTWARLAVEASSKDRDDSQVSADQSEEGQLKERVVELEARCTGLQVLLDNTAVALEAKLLQNDIRSDFENQLQETAVSMQVLRSEIQEQLEATGADLSSNFTQQISELRSKIEDTDQAACESGVSLRDKVGQGVQAGLVDFFSGSQTTLAEGQLSLPARLQGLEEAVQGCVSREDLSQLRARVEGGFDAMVVRMEAEKWIAEETRVGADKIVRKFTFNMDKRIGMLEHRLDKADMVVDTPTQTGHFKTKKVKIPRQLAVPKRALRAAHGHNFNALKVCFDFWARGSSAACLRCHAANSGDGRSSPGGATSPYQRSVSTLSATASQLSPSPSQRGMQLSRSPTEASKLL